MKSFSPGGEEPFHIALSRVENQLHPIVSKALWAEAAQDLGIAVDEEIRTANLLADDADPLTLAGYQRLARHHNKLVEIHDDLLQQLPFPSVEVSETDYSSKPVTRLTKAASNALVKEIERIDSILYRTRVTYRIQKSKGQYGETPVFKT